MPGWSLDAISEHGYVVDVYRQLIESNSPDLGKHFNLDFLLDDLNRTDAQVPWKQDGSETNGVLDDGIPRWYEGVITTHLPDNEEIPVPLSINYVGK